MTSTDSPETDKPHLFFDAEGTLYITRNDRMKFKDFWDGDHTIERAREMFTLDSGVKELLEYLSKENIPMYIVSKYHKDLLPELLEHLEIRSYFTEVLINGDKGERIEEYLVKNNIDRRKCLMLGDMYDLDIEPVRDRGIFAILVDRYYNRNHEGPRMGDFNEFYENFLECSARHENEKIDIVKCISEKYEEDEKERS